MSASRPAAATGAMPWSCAAGQEVRADEAVGARAADEEAAGEQPEGAAARGVAAGRRTRRRPGCRWRCRAAAPRWRRRAAARRRPAARAGTARRRGRRRARRGRRRATPSASRSASVSAASTGRKTSWPVALAAVSTPVTRPRRATNQRLATVAARTWPSSRCRARRRRPTAAPGASPAVARTVSPRAGAHQQQREQHHAADAEALHRGGRERAGEAEQHEVDADGEADGPAGEAVLLQRHEQDAGRRAEAAGGQQRQEGDAGDDPGVVDAGRRPCTGHEGRSKTRQVLRRGGDDLARGVAHLALAERHPAARLHDRADGGEGVAGVDGPQEADLDLDARVGLALRQGRLHGAAADAVEQGADQAAVDRADRVVDRLVRACR